MWSSLLAVIPFLILVQGCKRDLQPADCPGWAGAGYCLGAYEDYMKDNCCVSCGYTQFPTMPATATPSESPTTADMWCPYKDESALCPTYVSAGYCIHTHTEWMLSSCRASCECFGGLDVDWTHQPSELPSMRPTMPPTRRLPCMNSPDFKLDVDEPENCARNDGLGYCDPDHDYHWFMEENCWYTCYCGDTDTPTPAPTLNPTKEPTLTPTKEPTVTPVDCGKITKRGLCKQQDQCEYDKTTSICKKAVTCDKMMDEDSCNSLENRPGVPTCFWFGENLVPYCAEMSQCQREHHIGKCKRNPKCVYATRKGSYGKTCQNAYDFTTSKCGKSLRMKGAKGRKAKTHDVCDCKQFCAKEGAEGFSMVIPNKDYQKTTCRCWTKIDKIKNGEYNFLGGRL